MARRLTPQEQEEFFSSIAAAPDAEPCTAFSNRADPSEAKAWAGIPESIDLDILDGYDWPEKS